MNKSLLTLFLVCAIAGMAYAVDPSPYNEVEEQDDDDARQLIQLLKALQTMDEIEDRVSQQSTGKRANAQFNWKGLLSGALKLGGSALKRYLAAKRG